MMFNTRGVFTMYRKPMISRTQYRTVGKVGRAPVASRRRSSCRNVNTMALGTT